MNVEWHRKNINDNIKILDYFEMLPEPNEDNICEITKEQTTELLDIHKGLMHCSNAIKDKFGKRYIGTSFNIHFVKEEEIIGKVC